MLKVKVKIEGMAPILFHRFPSEDFDEEGSKEGKKPKLSGTKLTREEQTEKSLYRNSEGKIYTPGEHLVGAMIKAGAKFKMKGRTTFKESMNAGVFVEPMKIVHDNQDYVSDWRPVVNRGSRVMCGRGRLEEWSLQFDLICIDDRVGLNDLKAILTYAGNYIGIGAYRPRYGRFEVVEFKEIN